MAPLTPLMRTSYLEAPKGFGFKLRQRDFILQENRFLISVYYIVMLLISYIMVVWATMLREPTGIDHGRHGQKNDSIDGCEAVAIAVYVSTLAMVINLVVVYLFVVCMGQRKQGYVSV